MLPLRSCACNRTQGVTPFTLADRYNVVEGPKGRIYTFTVISSTPSPGRCADTSLYKLELWSSLACRSAVAQAYINGRQVAVSYDNTFGVWKVTNVGLNATLPGPAVVGTIGIELYRNGPCPTLATLCTGRQDGQCIYSMFDISKTCCPVGYNIVIVG